MLVTFVAVYECLLFFLENECIIYSLKKKKKMNVLYMKITIAVDDSYFRSRV